MAVPSRTERSGRAYLLWIAAIVVMLVIFPPLRFHSADAPEPARAKAGVAPQAFAQTFWEQTLPKSEASAVDLAVLWKALEQDSAAAMEMHGQRAGVGSRPVFLVRGDATVTSIDERGVWLRLGSETSGDTLLLSGPIFGNQVRDATGLIKIAEFSSFDFNSISDELNRLVEAKVQPALREHAVAGAQLTLFGAAELDDASSERLTLKIVPIRVAWK